MNRSEVVEGIASIERELRDQRISQDTLVVLHRQITGLLGYAERYALPTQKPAELIEEIESRMDLDSIERARNDGVIPDAEPRPIPAEDMGAELQRVRELGFEPAGNWSCPSCGGGPGGAGGADCVCGSTEGDPPPVEPPCEHPNKSFNDDGLPVCNDCGHIFQPPPTKPTIDRKTAIDDLFGKG